MAVKKSTNIRKIAIISFLSVIILTAIISTIIVKYEFRLKELEEKEKQRAETTAMERKQVCINAALSEMDIAVNTWCRKNSEYKDEAIEGANLVRGYFYCKDITRSIEYTSIQRVYETKMETCNNIK